MSRFDHRLAAFGVVLGLVAASPTDGGAQSLGAIPMLGAWSPKERWHPISLQDSIARQASSTRDR